MRSEKAQQRFLQEAQIAQRLAHPNIVNTYDLGEHGEVRFITMELLEGCSLAEWLQRRKVLSLSETLGIIDQVLQGLAYAHETTVHRDLKPQNVFLCRNHRVKLLDFGLARVAGSSQFMQSSMAVGTAGYMAPEQLAGQPVTPQTDLYSVGVILYQCLTGTLPVGRFKLPSELSPGLPSWIDEVMERLLAPTPEARYRHATAVRRALRAPGEREPAAPRVAPPRSEPAPLPPPPPPWPLPSTLVYADFGTRTVAFLIDLGIGFLILMAAEFVVGAVIGFLLGLGGVDDASFDALFDPLAAVFGTPAVVVSLWLYYAGLEASSKQATVGKILLGLRVTDLAGFRVSFKKATGRYFAKVLSALLLLLGFVMAAFTERKQALHDILAGTVVVKNPSTPLL